MKLKGHAKIELTNVKTGEKRVYEHDNDITGFAAEYFKECGALNTDPIGSLKSGAYPSYPLDELFGGIMCFDDSIDEDEHGVLPIYAPAGVHMMANGSCDFTDDADTEELGHYLPSQSAIRSQERSYCYQWNEDEGLGDISCICLTSKRGGYIGVGNHHDGEIPQTSEYDRTHKQFGLFDYRGNPAKSTNQKFGTGVKGRFAGLDISKGQFALLSTTAKQAFANGKIVVNWHYAPVTKLNPFLDTQKITDVDVYPTDNPATLAPVRVYESETFTAVNVTNARVCGGTGYIMIIGSSTAEISNGSTIYVKQIGESADGSGKKIVTSFSCTISGMGSNSISISYDDSFIGGKIINGDLYICGGSHSAYATQTYAYKIASNGQATNFSSNATNPKTSTERMFLVQNGRVYFSSWSCYDTVDNDIYYTNANRFPTDSYSYMYNMGLWNCYDCSLPVCVSGGQTDIVMPLGVLRPMDNWLSTINNITPVTKTTNDIMKITYTISLSAE